MNELFFDSQKKDYKYLQKLKALKYPHSDLGNS